MTWNGNAIADTSQNLHGLFTYSDATSYGSLSCSSASSKSKTPGQEQLVQVWRAGTAYEIAITITQSNPSANIARSTITIQNYGDFEITAFTLNLIGFEFGEIPGGNCESGEGAIRGQRFSSRYYGYSTWSGGSVSWGMGNYLKNGGVVTSCNNTTNKLPRVEMPYPGALKNWYDSLTPGQSQTYVVDYVFGDTDQTEIILSSSFMSAFFDASPYKANWPDRRPIMQWFWANNNNRRSATNPRALFADASLNALDPTTLSARALTETTAKIAEMDARAWRPQGIIIWDLEGYEFNHSATYIGNPSKLSTYAAEIDGIADQVFFQLKSAGYRIGMTIRQQDLSTVDGGTHKQWAITGSTLSNLTVTSNTATATTSTAHGLSTGNIVTLRGATTSALNSARYSITVTGSTAFTFTTAAVADGTYNESGLVIGYAALPATCSYNANSQLTEKAVITGTYTYPSQTRTATCTGTNQWSFNANNNGPGSQTDTNDYDTVYQRIRDRIAYAVSRWGASIFYVDSNVNTTGNEIESEVFSLIKEEFPRILMIPESSNASTVIPTASYLNYETLGAITIGDTTFAMNPAGFSVTQVGSKSPNLTPTTTSQWLTMLGRGSTAFQNQLSPDNEVNVLKNTAMATNATVAMTDRGQARTFQSSPGTSFTYPVTARVYFADTSNNLASSTTYCTRRATDSCYLNGALQSTATLDLAATPYYQFRYYDFAGNLVSNPGSYGIIE